MLVTINQMKGCKNILENFSLKQDRQCRHNITLRCSRESIVALEKQYVFHYLSMCL